MFDAFEEKLADKIRNKKNGILLYGITPPKINHTREETEAIAQKHIERISGLPIDGLVLYDIQDESDRTDETRPFPFIKTLDPCEYSDTYLKPLQIPRIVYRAVGNYTQETFTQWLEKTKEHQVYSVFVGAASRHQKKPLSLGEAYRLKREVNAALCLGGICIPERHMVKHDEHLRVFGKTDRSCEYFITQCVYNLEASKTFLTDYASYARAHGKPIVPIIFTLTPCGSAKTLDFMQWLGISIPLHLEEKLRTSDDILNDSLQLSIAIFKELYHLGKTLGVPIGCNVESVAIRKVEIEAAIELLHSIKKIMDEA